ncbi:hypothetical protein DRO53_00300 [Candidatus Bathyarchaeota archaeon]|nr:MAG: hypothetical protein DRO46_01400 [Candidatus Hecatellales archaeon]RLI35767.1 MAG: hypothetical protein DRO53_00300 [Candidatus Bathyarchaeota archaeon]
MEGVNVASEEAKIYEQVVRNTVTQKIMETLESGEKTLSELVKAVNELVPEPLDDLIIKLYLSQLEMEGLIEKKDKGGEAAYNVTDKWKSLSSAGKG